MLFRATGARVPVRSVPSSSMAEDVAEEYKVSERKAPAGIALRQSEGIQCPSEPPRRETKIHRRRRTQTYSYIWIKSCDKISI